MPSTAKNPNWFLALAGAIAGFAVGYAAFWLLVRLGIYGLVLPGALLGLGCGALSGGNSNRIGIVCGALALVAGILTEWRFAPFRADASLGFFLAHVQDLSTLTLVTIAGGGLFGFWFGRGREGGVWPRRVRKVEAPVLHNMSEMRATANAHLRRDMEAGGKWTCECKDCHEVRSLIGVEKTLDVRPLVRKILKLEEQMEEMPDGPDKRLLLDEYLKAYDELAEVMSR
ncbi:MAG TPA: hypothetical protein VGP63_12645, partial [Planctomycetaceae bacterium]|jgi:hypothetical protein|nr:hypothetical protein [Planctomycetaceae bacterium]